MNQMILKPTILTSKDVCEILKISPRTLQTYRNNRMLAFMQIGRKIYYNASDIEVFLISHHIKSKPLINAEKI